MFRFLRFVVVLFLLLVSLPPAIAILAGAGPDPSALPPPGKLVAVGAGVRLNVIERGTGRPIVLVHGLPGIAADWEPLLSKLAATNRVIAYDRAGYGYSDKPEGGYEIVSDARRLLELVDALGLDHPVPIGWSYGGGIVQEAARLGPTVIDRLVLIAAIGPGLDFRGQTRRSRVVALLDSRFGLPLSRWVFGVPPLARMVVRSMSAEAYSTRTGIPQAWLERSYAHMSQWGSQRTFVEEARLMIPKALQPEKIQVPALVIAGTDDRVVPRAVAEDLDRRLPHSALFLVPGASHMVPVTHAEQVARKIRAFLAAGAG